MEQPLLVRPEPAHRKSFVIRKATAADAAAICVLLRESFIEFKALYTPEAFAATVVDEPGILGRLEEGPIWVAEAESSVIGTVGSMIVSELATIRGMSTHPAARGQGISKCLLDHVETFARGNDARLLTLYTTAFLYQAIRLYQAAGFTFTGEKTSPHGTELLRMTKDLTQFH